MDIVTRSPVTRHQLVHSGFFGVLLGACPAHLRVLSAPMDVVLAGDTVVQPDLLVGPSRGARGSEGDDASVARRTPSR